MATEAERRASPVMGRRRTNYAWCLACGWRTEPLVGFADALDRARRHTLDAGHVTELRQVLTMTIRGGAQ